MTTRHPPFEITKPENTILRRVKVRPSQWLALERLAFRRGTSVNEQVRLALAQYLRREQYR